MSVQEGPQIPVRSYRRAGIAVLAVLALTAVHHAYGAVAYDTPWRLHVALIAPIVGLGIVRALYLGGSQRGKRSGEMWTRMAVALILLLPVGLIGLVEGGYNHLAKSIVYFGWGAKAALPIFPPPTYEMPNDLLFEATGIAQFPLALVAARLALALFRTG